MKVTLPAAMRLLRALIDPKNDPCFYDHLGHCQAHGYLSLTPGEECPHAVAARMVTSYAIGRDINDSGPWPRDHTLMLTLLHSGPQRYTSLDPTDRELLFVLFRKGLAYGITHRIYGLTQDGILLAQRLESSE